MPSLQNIAYPNGLTHMPSWASVEIEANGLVYMGFKSLTYSDELVGVKVYGTAPQPIGRTRGKGNANGAAVMYKNDWENFRASLGGGQGYMEIPILITATIYEIGMNPIVDLLQGVRIQKAEDAHSESADALVVSLTLDIFRVSRSGGDSATLPFPTL